MVSDEAKRPPQTPAQDPAVQSAAERTHTIHLESLIVHRYSEHDALFQKADKVARGIIEAELREGESVRMPKPGRYRIFMPKLKPEAGALRCSVIAEQIARAVRDLNPTSMALERRRHEQVPPPTIERRRAPTSSGPARPLPPRSTPTSPDQRDEQAIRDAANRALAAMAQSNTGQAEDFNFSDTDRQNLESLSPVFQPVWHAKNNLITGYSCQLMRDGQPLSFQDINTLLPHDAPDLATAKLDATLYGHAAKAMEYLLTAGQKAVLIVPVHFSTVDRLRYMGAFLEAGARVPDSAKQLIVFELTHLPLEISRFRLREPVNYLRTRARALTAQPGLLQTNFDLFKEFNFHGVSVDLRHYDLPEARLLKSFDGFVAHAEKSKLQTFVHGISNTSLAVGAMASGFTYIEGSAISPPVSKLEQIRPYEIDMLYES
jgi:EAL domain-containing protein (putative c-di-GMP-specific phosphodiesterase class I)